MGSADYYLEGAWNARCQECSRKIKSVDARLRWDNFWVCDFCWEQRNPQDFIRGIPDNPSVPWSTGDDRKLPLDTLAPTIGCAANQPGRKFMLIGSWLVDSQLLV